jgi:dTDP-4-dehydrorhamnose 3,5-epimerase-like enzyme
MEKNPQGIKEEKMIANTTLIPLKVHGDKRGFLVALENGHNLPFEVKRVYYIYGTKEGTARGFHAHRKLKQLLISVSGSVEIHCEMHAKKSVYTLAKPDEGLLIEGFVWREMHNFSSDCVLMILTDDYYNEDDYIRDYQSFLEEAR